MDRGVELVEPHGFAATPGAGVRAEVDGRSVVVGNLELMRQDGIAVDDGLEGQAEAGATAVSVAVDGQRIGIITLTDAIKDVDADTPSAACTTTG